MHIVELISGKVTQCTHHLTTTDILAENWEHSEPPYSRYCGSSYWGQFVPAIFNIGLRSCAASENVCRLIPAEELRLLSRHCANQLGNLEDGAVLASELQ